MLARNRYGSTQLHPLLMRPHSQETKRKPRLIHWLLLCRQGVITGQQRATPARVFDLFPFNYELDVLEMRLHELNDTVDFFVILESTRSHRGMRKPLGLARNIERFSKFADKIVHVVLDDAELLSLVSAAEASTQADFWDIDMLQHNTLLAKALKAGGGFRDDDIVMSMCSGEASELEVLCVLSVTAVAGLFSSVGDVFGAFCGPASLLRRRRTQRDSSLSLSLCRHSERLLKRSEPIVTQAFALWRALIAPWFPGFSLQKSSPRPQFHHTDAGTRTASDADEMGHAEAVRILRHCEVEPCLLYTSPSPRD